MNAAHGLGHGLLRLENLKRRCIYGSSLVLGFLKKFLRRLGNLHLLHVDRSAAGTDMLLSKLGSIRQLQMVSKPTLQQDTHMFRRDNSNCLRHYRKGYESPGWMGW